MVGLYSLQILNCYYHILVSMQFSTVRSYLGGGRWIQLVIVYDFS